MRFQLLFSPLQRNTADHQQIKKKKKIILFISCWNKHWNYLILLQLVQQKDNQMYIRLSLQDEDLGKSRMVMQICKIHVQSMFMS